VWIVDLQQRVQSDVCGAGGCLVLQACAELSPDASYRPRIVYVVVQKRHHVRLFEASQPQQLRNLEPGTVIDHTIVSAAVSDFYLNSHKDIPNTGMRRWPSWWQQGHIAEEPERTQQACQQASLEGLE
jgi:hypothetical protein